MTRLLSSSSSSAVQEWFSLSSISDESARQSEELIVQVVCAKGIKAADRGGTSDPFASVRLIQKRSFPLLLCKMFDLTLHANLKFDNLEISYRFHMAAVPNGSLRRRPKPFSKHLIQFGMNLSLHRWTASLSTFLLISSTTTLWE